MKARCPKCGKTLSKTFSKVKGIKIINYHVVMKITETGALVPHVLLDQTALMKIQICRRCGYREKPTVKVVGTREEFDKLVEKGDWTEK